MIEGSQTITVPTTLTTPTTITTFGQTFTWSSSQPESAVTSAVPFLPLCLPRSGSACALSIVYTVRTIALIKLQFRRIEGFFLVCFDSSYCEALSNS